MKRRLLSAFLAVMMVLTMAPVAFAADETNTTSVGSYEDLVNAIASAGNGATITLNGDIDVQQTLVVTKGLTLDLAGHKLHNTNNLWDDQGNNWSLISVRENGDLTITGNGTLDAKKDDCYAVDVQDVDASVTIADGTFVGNIHAVYVQEGTAFIKGGSYSIQQKYPDAAKANEFVLNCYDASRRDYKAKIYVSGGSFEKFNPADCKAEGEGTNFCEEGYTTTQNGDTYAVEAGTNAAVANAGANYNTIATAIAVVKNGGAVTLLKDTAEDVVIPADKMLTIDLAGHKLTNVNSHTIFNKGTLTINGNKGTVDNVTNGTAALYNKGTVVVNGGTFDRSKENGTTKSDSGENTWYTIKNVGTMTINDGVTVQTAGNNSALGKYSSLFSNGYFDSGDYTANKGIEQPTLTINGGLFRGGLNTIKNDDRAKITIVNGTFTNYYQAVVMNHNVAEIKGGTFTAASDADSETYGIYNCGCAADIDLGTLTVSGGTFTGATYAVADVSSEPAVVTISDGKFAGTKAAIVKSRSSKASISISGGDFSSDPSAYCVTGKTGVSSGDSTYPWTVGEKIANTKPAEVADATVAATVDKNASDAAKDAAKDIGGATMAQNEAIKAAAKNEANKNTIDADTPVDGKTVTQKLQEVDSTITSNDVKIVYQTYIDVEVKDAAKENSTFTELTVELTPMYRVIAAKSGVTDYHVDVDKNTPEAINAVQIVGEQPLTLTGKYEVTLQLPNGFVVPSDNKLSIKHQKSSGVEYYTGTVTATNSATKMVTFETNGFSPFTISAVAAYVGTTAYPSLQEAANAANSGDIIVVKNGASHDLTFTATKSVKVKNDTGVAITVKFNGTDKGVAKDATETFSYTKPSSGSSGGSSSGKTTYKVTTSAVNNGGVNASPSNAEKGATITITLSPDKGYKLDKLTVTDGSGKTVSTVKKSDTVYTFTMPASAVKVGVSYVKATETPSKTKFNDVSANDWFASAVDYVTGKGMMNGTADNTFSPKANTTRGMVVTVLYRLENQPSTSAASFTDVASGAYYANAVAWANANGIVSGYGSGKFGPNDKVTREQLAAILYRYAQYKKYDVSVGEDTNILSYDDAQSISTYAIPAIQWACGAGVVTGKSGSKLDPKGNATRAEVAAMLMRFCENVK